MGFNSKQQDVGVWMGKRVEQKGTTELYYERIK
jgi:hypothetical protein